jgi:hypothetical protein
MRLGDIRDLPPTMEVPDAGWRFYRLGRSGSYAAAKRGDIPTIRVGRRLVVPTARILSMLGIRT